MIKRPKSSGRFWLAALASSLLLLGITTQAQTTTPNVTVEILGTGAESLIGGDLTDPENDGLDELGAAADPSWNWTSITSSHESDFEGAENSFNIFDNKVGGGNDKWCCDDPIADTPVWVAVGFAQPISLTHFTVSSGNDSTDRDPTDWAIQGSNDGQAYTDVYRFFDTTVPWTERNQVVKFTLPAPSTAYRYFRYIAYDTPGTLHQINEIEYFGIVGGVDVKDTDKDGMPDDWETKYGLNPNDATDAAKDLNSNGFSNLDEYKLFLDPTDTTKPTIVSAVANANFDTVVLTFSKLLGPRGDLSTATNLANYSISPALAISAATVKDKVVTLTTAKQTPGATAYTITVNNVKDVNNWPVAADTKVIFYSYLLVKTGINSGLRAYWNFDAKNFEDTINEFDGTQVGSNPIEFVAGKTGFGQAIQLDGVDQYVQITGGAPDDLAFAGKSISISAWFTVGSFDKSWQALVAKGEGSNWRVARNDVNSTMSYAGGLADVTGTKDVSDGNWHHLVAISDASGLNFGTAIYVDGVRDGIVAGKAALAANGSRVAIGENPGATGRSWTGQIDDVAIWGRVLSEAEITAMYSGGAGKPISALAATTTDLPVPPDGSFVTQIPAPNARNVLPTTDITIEHADGKTPWTAADVTMKFNGVAVTPTFTKDGEKATIKFTPTALLASATPQTITLGHKDPGGNPTTTEWSFTTVAHSGVAKDVVNSHSSIVLGGAKYTADAGGSSGKAGDYAIDLGMAAASIYVPDAKFLNEASKSNEMSFAMWIKKYDIVNSWAFSANSPTVEGGPRSFSAHTPWGDGVIYFDTAGCCDADAERISANIDTFADYTGDAAWWNTWRHYAFTKKGDAKQIWVDGKLFLEGTGTDPLPTDYSDMYIGAGATGTESMHGLIDDFAVFATALTEANVNALFKRTTSPKDLTSAKPIAYWDFNTLPVVTPDQPTLKLERTGNGIVLTFEGTLQSADAINGTWIDVTQPSPLTITPTGSGKFYRAKR